MDRGEGDRPATAKFRDTRFASSRSPLILDPRALNHGLSLGPWARSCRVLRLLDH